MATEGHADGRGRLDGRVAVVTGAGHGIGAASAARLAADGAIVGVCDIREDGAADVAAAINRAGGRAEASTADVADPEAVACLLAEVEERLGPIEILQNNAGRLVPGAVLTQDIAGWQLTCPSTSGRCSS